MSRFETVVSPTSPGAGRMWDFTWPDPQFSSAITLNVRNRQGITISASQTAKGGVGTMVPGVVNGVDVANVVAGVADGTGLIIACEAAMRAHLITVKGNGIPTTVNDFAAWRWLCVMAFSATPGVLKDYGFEVLVNVGPSNGMISDGASGFAFLAATDGTVSLAIQGPLGFSLTPLTNPATFDKSKLHTYEFRAISATDAAEATLKIFIDGLQVATRSWGAGSVLPQSTAALPGYFPMIANLSGNNGLYIAQLRGMASQTEQGTL